MRLFFSLALGAAALAATAVLAQDNYPVPDPSHIVFTPPKDVKWKTGAAMDSAVIFGDPGKPGIYGLLLRWHPNNFSRPHFHTIPTASPM